MWDGVSDGVEVCDGVGVCVTVLVGVLVGVADGGKSQGIRVGQLTQTFKINANIDEEIAKNIYNNLKSMEAKDVIDMSRDNNHPGPLTHQIVADKILKLL